MMCRTCWQRALLLQAGDRVLYASPGGGLEPRLWTWRAVGGAEPLPTVSMITEVRPEGYPEARLGRVQAPLKPLCSRLYTIIVWDPIPLADLSSPFPPGAPTSLPEGVGSVPNCYGRSEQVVTFHGTHLLSPCCPPHRVLQAVCHADTGLGGVELLDLGSAFMAAGLLAHAKDCLLRAVASTQVRIG
jgi:hypothetical protein